MELEKILELSSIGISLVLFGNMIYNEIIKESIKEMYYKTNKYCYISK